MQGVATSASPARRYGFAANVLIVLGSFYLLVLASLPIFLSFDLWLFEDRSSFLHLDELARHYRLGVDVFYSYGLLPVLLQHLVFWLFGTSFRPMLGCYLIVFALTAIFFATLLQYLPQQRRWLIAIVLLPQIILVVNSTLPYALAVLSILFALLFVLKDRLDLALALAATGCFCVPSLTLILTLLIVLLIVLNWSLTKGRSMGRLVVLLLPGALTYILLAVLLGSVYSFQSLAATALPLAGARFYKEIGYSGFDAFLTFLHPSGYDLKYYVAYYAGSPITWFVLCSLFLFSLSLYSLAPLIKGLRLAPAINMVVLFSIVQFCFIFFVYGARGQHAFYEGILAAVTLVGISTLPRRPRKIALAVFLATGILAQTGTLYKTVIAWRTTARSQETFGLYADPEFAKELADVVKLSQGHKTLMLGYATGIHNYYPTLEDPDAWFLQKGQLFPHQRDALVDQINQSDMVVEVLISPSAIVSEDKNIQAALNAMQLTPPRKDFRIRVREPIR